MSTYEGKPYLYLTRTRKWNWGKTSAKPASENGIDYFKRLLSLYLALEMRELRVECSFQVNLSWKSRL